MQRRDFLKTVTALAGIPAVAPGHATTVHAHIGILIQESPVAGFQYHEGEDIWQQLTIGDALRAQQPARPSGGPSSPDNPGC